MDKITRKSVIWNLEYIDFREIKDPKKLQAKVDEIIHHMSYVDNREGVLIEKTNKLCTQKQRELIIKMLSAGVQLDSEKYQVFLADSTCYNADQLIKSCLEFQENKFGNVLNYFNYANDRKGVLVKEDSENQMLYGSFDKQGVISVFDVNDSFLKNVVNEKNIFWRSYLPIEYDFANDLGYDKLEKWHLLFAKVMPKIAKELEVDYNDFYFTYNIHYKNKPETGAHNFHAHLHYYGINKVQIRHGKDKTQKIMQNIHKIIRSEIFSEQKLEVLKQKDVQFEKFKNYLKIFLIDNIDKEYLKNYLDIDILNHKGSKKYGYLNATNKSIINKLLADIIKSNPLLAKEYGKIILKQHELFLIDNIYKDIDLYYKDYHSFIRDPLIPIKNKEVRELANILVNHIFTTINFDLDINNKLKKRQTEIKFDNNRLDNSYFKAPISDERVHHLLEKYEQEKNQKDNINIEKIFDIVKQHNINYNQNYNDINRNNRSFFDDELFDDEIFK